MGYGNESEDDEFEIVINLYKGVQNLTYKKD